MKNVIRRQEKPCMHYRFSCLMIKVYKELGESMSETEAIDKRDYDYIFTQILEHAESELIGT